MKSNNKNRDQYTQVFLEKYYVILPKLGVRGRAALRVNLQFLTKKGAIHKVLEHYYVILFKLGVFDSCKVINDQLE